MFDLAIYPHYKRPEEVSYNSVVTTAGAELVLASSMWTGVGSTWAASVW